MIKFVWDKKKNDANYAKHGATFEQAKETFTDPNAIVDVSSRRGELRFLRIGKTAGRILITVIYTIRETAVRIISARSPRKNEQNAYIKNSLINQSKDQN